MDAQRYLINGKVYPQHDPGLQEVLARVYGTPARPRCLCVDGGVEMYVSKFRDFVIKRMPESGTEHAPTCPSYELPPSESGLGQLLGEAIIDRGREGVELRLDFPLTRYQGRSRACALSAAPTEVAATRRQLSLQGLLHYLWERAGFTRWHPQMRGKRSYGVVRKFLLQACSDIETKGLPLRGRLVMPEPFVAEHAAEIAARHRKAFAPLAAGGAPSRSNLMIAIGQVKALAPTTVGYQLVLKHLPDCPLFLELSTAERAKRAFEHELVAWANGQVRLVAACLIHARVEHCYEIDALSLMMTSPEWILLNHISERDVVAKLVAEERAFIKPLRYDATDPARFANYLLLDAGARPLPLDIVSAFAHEADRRTKLDAIASRQPKGWVWDTARDAIVPELPPKASPRAGG
ncbi:MAG: DUF1173 domain-containing protein [Proteobacteria bacterium]|nr:DUF1173 domain-containing protein [Pseudomonadota bacterium]